MSQGQVSKFQSRDSGKLVLLGPGGSRYLNFSIAYWRLWPMPRMIQLLKASSVMRALTSFPVLTQDL